MRRLHVEERTNYPLMMSVDDLGEGFALTVQVREQVQPRRICELMHDVLARHALWLVKSDLEMKIRAALLVRHATPDAEYWSRLLWVSGVTAAVFTDSQAAVKWLHSHAQRTDTVPR